MQVGTDTVHSGLSAGIFSNARFDIKAYVAIASNIGSKALQIYKATPWASLS